MVVVAAVGGGGGDDRRRQLREKPSPNSVRRFSVVKLLTGPPVSG